MEKNLMRFHHIVMTAVCLAMIMIGCLGVTGEVLHKVGGSKGWKPDVNYTEWSAKEHFVVGDWLYFKFNKLYFNVLEVNKTSYESCNDKEFIKNVTHGGRDVVQLTAARMYYYISSGGYCYHQMKVAVNVSEEPSLMSPAPAPSSQNSSGSLMHYSMCSHALIALLLLLIMWFI